MGAQIFYFSGTGNSLFVARELQKRIPDSAIIPIARLLKSGVPRAEAQIVGFVFPVHALTIPIAVKRFVSRLDLRSSEYIFAVATRQGTVFRGFEKIDHLLRRQNKRLDSHFILQMCNNESRHEGYVVPTKDDILSVERAVLCKLDAIQGIVNNRITSREEDRSYTIDSGGNPVASYLTEKVVLSCMALSEYIGGVNYFYADPSCTGCGICEKVCLSEKIKMVEQRPVWQRDVLCYMCFACLNFCPRASVQIKSIPGVKSFTKENGRYPHPYATITDISDQKGV